MRRAALLVAALAASCGGEPASAEVRVFAAASLTEVMQRVAAEFERETGRRVKLNVAASSVLAKQIVEGARCDVFLSADEECADFVEKAGLVEPGTRSNLLTNSLAVVSREDLHGRLPVERGVLDATGFRDQLRASTGRVAMGDPTHVPAGRYARGALQQLGLWLDVRSRVVPCESVRAALALAERDEVDYAIVYATDAKASRSLLGHALLPPVPGVQIRYPALGVKGIGFHGRAFLRFLRSKSAVDAFRRAGFMGTLSTR